MKYFYKNKFIFILLTFLFIFGIGNIIAYLKSDEILINVNYNDKLIIKDIALEYKDTNNIYGNMFEVIDIKNNTGNSQIKLKSNKSGEANIVVTCNFMDNDISSYITKSIPVRVNNHNMIFTGNKFTDLVSIKYIYYSFIIFLGFLSVYMFLYFKNGLKNNLYSYNTIFYCSSFLFFICLFLVYVISLIYVIPNYNEVNLKILSLVTSNIMTFFVLSAVPIILIFTISVTISNIMLMKREGKRVTNALGIIISILMFIGLIILLVLSYYSRIVYIDNIALSITYSIVGSIYVFLESILFGVIICSLYAVKRKIKLDVDYIIILGCKIGSNNKPLPLLKGRIDRALAFYHEELNKTGKKLIFVPSGGKGNDENISESEAISNYLIEQGIEKNQIILENKSTTTKENIIFSMKLINDKKANILLSTTNYHVFRSSLIAKELGFNIPGIGSKTKWYFWPNAFIREVVGILVTQKKKQIILLLVFALLAGLSAFLYTIL